MQPGLNKINKNTKTAVVWSFLLLSAVFVLLVPILAQAQASLGLETARDLGLGSADLKLLIARIVRIVLGFLGIIAVIINIYAGYLWLASQGDEEKIGKAKKILLNGVIGLAIILSAYLIVSYVIGKFNEAMFTGGEQDGRGGYFYNGQALGGGILESVYPEPGAGGVPRNTLIMVTFREAVDAATILSNQNRPRSCDGFAENACGFLRNYQINGQDAPSVKIINRSSENQPWLGAQEVVAMTNDSKTFVLDPTAYLGSENGDTDYSVNLTDEVKKADGSAAFLPGGFVWSFGVSSVLDVTPPRVVSVAPAQNEIVARNIVLQFNFSEAINAIGATGIASGNPEEPFNNILISYAGANGNVLYMSGTARISNRFRTVEFASSIACELPEGMDANSCGEVPTCFLASEEFNAVAKAATVNENGETINILSGITDSAGNSLDGNNNGRPEGPESDNFSSDFATNDSLDLTPPHIIDVSPAQGLASVARDSLISAEFNERILSGSAIADNVRVFESACNQLGDFPQDEACYPPGGFSVYKEDQEESSRVVIRTYSPYLDPLHDYNPRLNSQVKDLYQNCFNPPEGPCGEGQNSPACP